MKTKKKKGAHVDVILNYKYNIFAGDVQFYGLYLDTLVIVAQRFREKSQLSRMNCGARLSWLSQQPQHRAEMDAPLPSLCDQGHARGHRGSSGLSSEQLCVHRSNVRLPQPHAVPGNEPSLWLKLFSSSFCSWRRRAVLLAAVLETLSAA